MAKPKMAATGMFLIRSKVRRPGVHGKTKSSQLKSSKLYKKRYRGQG
jgi:hypothetical protein